MTNPNDSVGTNAGYNGRTSSKAFNDVLGVISRGVLSGWACSPKTDMTVQLGGNGTDRDVAIAEDNAGNRTTINNRLGTPIDITLSAAPSTNNRIDLIVAYAENSIQGTGSSDVDFPSGVGIITVSGAIAANPTTPDETAIRNAITADGATGTNAFYVVLAEILVGTGVTTIGSGVITQGEKAQLANSTTTDITTAVNNAINTFKSSLTISDFNSADSVGTVSNITWTTKELTLAQSADGSTFKFYGRIYATNSTSSSRSITPVAVPGLSGIYGRATGLTLNTAPSSAFTISPAGIRRNSDSSKVLDVVNNQVAVGSDGQIYIFVTTNSSGISLAANTTANFFWFPSVYYNTNFGDSPES